MAKKGPKSPIPPGVEHAMILSAAAEPKGKQGLAQDLAVNYGVSDQVAKNFLSRQREKIDDIRGQNSEGCLVLQAHTLARISEQLADDRKMAETPIRDLATLQHKLGDIAVTLAEGHKPLVNFNFGDILNQKRQVEEWDRQMKKAKAS